ATRAGADSREGADTWLPFRREQRHGEDALLRRHATVQEGAAIPALILPQLGGIDEEAVPRGEQRVCPPAAARQLERILVPEQQREIGIFGPEILAELVAEVLRGVTLGEHRRRRVAVDGAVIA